MQPGLATDYTLDIKLSLWYFKDMLLISYRAVSGKDELGREFISLGHFKRVRRETNQSVWRCVVTGKSYGRIGVAAMRFYVDQHPKEFA